MDQPRKVAKPARGQLNREVKCSCRCIRGKYIYMYWYSTAVCIPGIYIFGRTFTFVHGSLCVVSFSHSFWASSSLDIPTGVTKEEGHTGFLISLLSAVCCCIICIYIYMCVTAAVCVCRAMFVCMAIAIGQGCQSCSWSAAG